MGCTSKKRVKLVWAKQGFCCVTALTLLLVLFCAVPLAAQGESVQHYKMISTVEYVGNGQFRNQVETLFTVARQPMSDNKVHYSLSTKDVGLVGGSVNSAQQLSLQGLSFVIDRDAQHLSAVGEDMAFWQKVNNDCVKSLNKVVVMILMI